MKCLICNKAHFSSVFDYETPDKYEQAVGLMSVYRAWQKCDVCGFFQSFRSYDMQELERIYKQTYRDLSFRGETIKEAYSRIMGMSIQESENFYRASWTVFRVEKCDVLDIGSGLGVFPKKLKEAGFNVECVEENEISHDFINRKLDIPCYYKIPDKTYDLITIVHVLEHIEEPDGFLSEINSHLSLTGKLFIEVPDAVNFKRLPQDHDDFNSCHVYMYDLSSLNKLLERNGLEIIDVARTHYSKRNTDRIFALCRKQTE